MDSIIVTGALLTLLLIGGLLIKGHIDKRRIEKVREAMDLTDDLRRIQNAMVTIPSLYLDTPTTVFMLKRTMELINKIIETSTDKKKLGELYQDTEAQLANALSEKDSNAQDLNKRSEINDPDIAHEIRALVKNLHIQTISSVKSGLIPKAHGARVVKNLKIIMQRTVIDMNYNIARAILQTKKLRPALSKYKATLALVDKSPIREHLSALRSELEKTIANIEKKLSIERKKNNENSAGELASGIDKIKEEEDWDVKKNIYD